MVDDNNRFVLYVCFNTDQEREICRSLAVVSRRSDVESWKRKQRNTELTDVDSSSKRQNIESSESAEQTPTDPQDHPTELSKLMSRFQETISSYRPLVRAGMIVMPTLRAGYIYNEMFKNANRHLEVVDNDDNIKVYGVKVDQYPSVNTQVRRVREFDRAITVLPGAILLSLVATFDSFIADTLRIMLRHRPERIIESSRMISVKEVLNMTSFDDVIGTITENEVDKIMRGSHQDQIRYIEENLGIRIRANYDNWGEFIEIFERRNLVAHGSNEINSHYIVNCKKNGLRIDENRIGEKFFLDGPYLRRSTELLLEFGLSLMFVLWSKHFGDSREIAYTSVNERSYDLIKDGQATVAAKLLDLALFRQTPSASDRVIKIMTINLANAYKKMKDNDKAMEIIRSVDWSAATDDFQICVAAVQGNIERIVELMPRVAQAKLLGKSEFREWPVFDWAREERVVRQKFQEVYGEPIIESSDEEANDDQQITTEINVEDTHTFH